MRLALAALALTGALAACTVTSTFENPNCEAYPYLRVCQDALDCPERKSP